MNYKNYEIEPETMPLADSKGWTLDVRITRHHGSHVASRPFGSTETFPSKEEAEERCIQFAKQIIDGRLEGCSVEDL